MSGFVLCFRFHPENPKVELLEVSGESGGEGGPLLEDGRAHGERSSSRHITGARNHPEETGGAMMVVVDRRRTRLCV